MRCLTSGRFSMEATILHVNSSNGDFPDPDGFGEWVDYQDPLTGQIVNVWTNREETPDNPDTAEYDPQSTTIKCLARGIVDGGIRVAGTTERFGDAYQNIEFVKMWVPKGSGISKRDRITNIKERNGTIAWVDEEFDPARATVFNVNGVTPLFDGPFNQHKEDFILLEKAEAY